MLLFRMSQIQRFGKADFSHDEKGKAKATTIWVTTNHTNHTKISFSVAKPSQKIRLSVLLPSPLLFRVFSVFRGFLAPHLVLRHRLLDVGCWMFSWGRAVLTPSRGSTIWVCWFKRR